MELYEFNFRECVGKELAISLRNVAILVARAPYSYKKYEITKKSGGKRLIAQPAKEIKKIQQMLIRDLFCYLPIHDCAAAYVKGASIKRNASQHRKNAFISKFDFKSFFSSINEKDIFNHLAKIFSSKISMSDISDIARVSCVNGFNNNKSGLCLSIGAPSSPVLSNSIMYDFDFQVFSWCRENDVIYTRYADDLTFSNNEPEILKNIEPFLRKITIEIRYPALVINDKKTIHLSKKHQRRVTGLVISNDGNISLGRDKKRLIRSMVHHYVSGGLKEKDICKLQGLLGFAKNVEFDFLNRLRKKYGDEIISNILKFRMKK